jgi:hypothetical protein
VFVNNSSDADKTLAKVNQVRGEGNETFHTLTDIRQLPKKPNDQTKPKRK